MTTQSTRPRRRGWARWLMLALLVVPVVEVFIIIKVGQTIGGWKTLALLVLWSAIGAWIVKREAGRAFTALRTAFSTGRMPARELADAALVLIGGTLLLAPGFVTDAIGLVVLLPFTRPVTRRVLERAVTSRLFGSVQVSPLGPFGAPAGTRQRMTSPYPTSESFTYGSTSGASTTGGAARRRGDVVEGEIID